MADDALPPIRGLALCMLGEKIGNLGLDRLGEQGFRTVA